MAKLQKLTACLWFDGQAEAAAGFYTAVFPNSKINKVVRNGDQVITVDFELNGVKFVALNGGPQFKFTEAVSFVVHCKNQKEIDYYWEKLTADGGTESQCAWLKDKFGLSWQVVPDVLPKLLSNPETAPLAMANLFRMQKVVIRQLTRQPKKLNITVSATIEAPVDQVWKKWTTPADIMQWCSASPDWHVPQASNDLRKGGAFSTTMAARDGSMSFDFAGIYDVVTEHKLIAYTMSDGRKVKITFKASGKKTLVTEVFEAEIMNPPDMQRSGWQSILDNFKRHTETNG